MSNINLTKVEQESLLIETINNVFSNLRVVKSFNGEFVTTILFYKDDKVNFNYTKRKIFSSSIDFNVSDEIWILFEEFGMNYQEIQQLIFKEFRNRYNMFGFVPHCMNDKKRQEWNKKQKH